MLTDGEYSTAKYLHGVVINVIFSKVQRLLMLPVRMTLLQAGKASTP